MGLSPQQAKTLLDANSVNLAKKVQAGQPLSPKDIAILETIARADGSAPGESEAEAPKMVTVEFAKNQTELAELLGVSRKTIQRYGKRKDAPTPRSNGRLCVAEWRAYLATYDVLTFEDDLDHATLKARQILLQNKILQQKIDLNDSVTVKVEEVERDIADLIMTAKTVLLSGPASLAPQVVGVSSPEAELVLREWLHSALSKLQQNPLGRAAEQAEALNA
jgi:DNA-binding transcriptional MerR regulator